MLIKYTLSVNNTNEKVCEIGKFKSLYYEEKYESLVIKLKNLMPIYLPMNSKDEMNSFADELTQRIKNKEEIIEIEGMVFNLEDDKDSDIYLSPEDFNKIKEDLKGYLRYSIK